jgi:hypothetical protein
VAVKTSPVARLRHGRRYFFFLATFFFAGAFFLLPQPQQLFAMRRSPRLVLRTYGASTSFPTAAEDTRPRQVTAPWRVLAGSHTCTESRSAHNLAQHLLST